MMADIERLGCVALEAAGFDDSGTPYLALDSDKVVVRAILQAMREPSSEAVDAGWKAVFDSLDENRKFHRSAPVAVWEAMIGQLLDESR